MQYRNNTNVLHFILMGLTDSEEIQQVLFMLFLLIYLITVLGNIGMVLIICLDLQLQTPMYFFLSHLSFLDLNYSTVITPKTLENLLNSNKSISFMGCFMQKSFFVFFGATELFLLSSMGYDCYVAICTPLHYKVNMSIGLCCAFITGSYIYVFINSLAMFLSMNSLHFCKSNVIYHFFCYLHPFLVLSCTYTHDTEIMIFIFAGSTISVSFIILSMSYMCILSTIMKIKPTSGKCKAFSTCASHLLGVTIFYGTMSFFLYKTKEVLLLGKGSSGLCVLYYCDPHAESIHLKSLRNKEVKNAVRVMQRTEGSRQLK